MAGLARQAWQAWRSSVLQGMAGKARCDIAGLGMAGEAWLGEAQSDGVRHGMAGEVRHGQAGCGGVWQARRREINNYTS